MTVTKRNDHVSVSDIGYIVKEAEVMIKECEAENLLPELLELKKLDIIAAKVVKNLAPELTLTKTLIICPEQRVRIQVIKLPDDKLSYNIKKQ